MPPWNVFPAGWHLMYPGGVGEGGFKQVIVPDTELLDDLGKGLLLLLGLVLWTSIPWLLLDRRISWRRLIPAGLRAGRCS